MAPLAVLLAAIAAAPVHVSLTGKRVAPIAGRPWTAALAVRPASFRGVIRVSATGPGRVEARASRRGRSYRMRLVFPAAGRWLLTARAGSSTSRLGSVVVRPAPRVPLVLSEPTTVEIEPSGTLLVVENNPGRLLRVDPNAGTVADVVPSLTQPFAVLRAPSGTTYVTSGNELRTVGASGGTTVVAEAENQIGPLTLAPNGDLYFSTATRIFRLSGSTGPPVHIAGTGVVGGGGDGGPALGAQFSAPHGLAVGSDGALLVSDTGNNRIRRIDPASGIITQFADVDFPLGMDVTAGGTVYLADGRAHRILHLSASGARIGYVSPEFGSPYDVEVAPDGVIYVLESGPVGKLQRIAPDGTVTRVSASPG
jgi:streptogramin lyase